MTAKSYVFQRYGLVGVLIYLLGCPAVHTFAQSNAEDRSLASMCERGLAESAILYAEAQRRHAVDLSLQAKWTMRIMECHALAALHSPSQAAAFQAAIASHWAAPAEIHDKFSQSQPSNPRLPWLAWQAARCELLHAQYALANHLAVPSDTETREATLESVRIVMRKTEDLLDDIKRRQPLAARGGRDGGAEAPAEQLAKLAVDTSLLQCEALLVRAKVYDAGSPDRIAAATEVETRAAEVVTRAAEDWSALEKLTIARATAQFELGNSEQALLVLEGLARGSADPKTKKRAAVLAIERLASAGENSRAQPLLNYLEQLGISPELALARMQLSLSELAATPEENRQRRLKELVTSAKAIGDEFGNYWRNRAEALLVGSVSSSSAGGTTVALDLMLVEVRQLLAASNVDGAIKKLLQFRDNESAADRGESAIQLASQAAALLNREQRWNEAITALESVVFKFETAKNAAEAHMLVIWARTQALRAEPSSADLKSAYEDSLQKQLSKWPDSEATDEAELWLANWLLAQGRNVEFIDALQQRIRATTNLEIAERTVVQWLQQVLTVNSQSESTACIHAIRSKTSRFELPQAQASAGIAAYTAEAFLVWPLPERKKEIEAELSQFRRTAMTPIDKQLMQAADLLAAVREKNVGIAPHLSDDWQPSQLPMELLVAFSPSFVEAIDELPITSQSAWPKHLKVDSEWIVQLQMSQKPLERAFGFRFVAWLENASIGLEGIASLSKTFPKDGNIQLQLSNALAASGENRIEESTAIASQLVAGTTPSSDLNLAARWRLVRNAMLAGDAGKAKRLAGLVLATLPDGNSIWRSRFGSIADSRTAE